MEQIKKKRKQTSTGTLDELPKRSKYYRGESGEGFQRNNLQLILSLRDKSMDLTQKVDLAFDYVQSMSTKVLDDVCYCSHVIDTSRTISSLSEWVLSVLGSSEKESGLKKTKPEFGAPGSFLDIKCWQILYFCLGESKRLHISLTHSEKLFQVIHSVVRDVLSYLSDPSGHLVTISVERLQFHDAVLDSLSLIFSSHSRVVKENLQLWILLIDKVLELVLKVVPGQIEGSLQKNFVLRLSCYLLEPFARFLRSHPMRKDGYRIFISNLLQPLLHLVHLLDSNSFGSQDKWRRDLSKYAEEVIAQGLFHSNHIDGFLSLQSSNKYNNSCDSTLKEKKPVNKSYHRHLFDRVEEIVAQKNESPLLGLWVLLHLFASSAAKNKSASVSGGVSMRMDVKSIFYDPMKPSLTSTTTPEIMDAELRKSVFDFFVQILEYLLADLNKCLQLDCEVTFKLFNVSIVLRSINNLLATFIRENLYLRTEDLSDGASRSFLMFIYTTVIPLSAKITHLETPSFGSDDRYHREVFISVRKELIITVRHLIDIEYNIVGDDLESLWILSLSSLPWCYGPMEVPDQSLLFEEIICLGCRIIDLYSDLRQVDISVFALCRAVRHSLSFVERSGECAPSSNCSSYTNALSILFCSSQFRRSLSNAVKVVPEGQLAKFIQQLSLDIKDSLEWIKLEHGLDGLGENIKSNTHHSEPVQLHMQVEILGKVLSDVYALILESVKVTWGNSSVVGDSLEDLIEIIRPSLSSLVSLQSERLNEFLILIDGKVLSKSTRSSNLSICWILKFLFHLLLLSRSLFRRIISLLPFDTAKEMSAIIDDPFLAQSIKDCLEMADFIYRGFFSWIVEPSLPLLDVIDIVSRICIQDSVVLCSPLLYVLTSMAIQRLVDLNKLIEISNYEQKWTRSMNQEKMKDGSDISPCSRKFISKAKKEAKGLTKFILDNISSTDRKEKSAPTFCCGKNVTLINVQHHNSDTLDFSVGSLDERSLSSALWSQICDHVDIWCSHAAKKDLKSFLTHLIETSIPYINDRYGHHRTDIMSKPGQENKVDVHQTALDFLISRAQADEFIWRYMAPRFCKILRKSASPLFATSAEDLGISPDWVEVMLMFEVLSDGQPWIKRKRAPAEICSKQNVGFETCLSLLTLLIRMPENYLGSRGSLLYIAHVLNLERLLVSNLLGQHNTPSSLNTYQILQLFTTCRMVLKILAVASSKEKADGSQSLLSCQLAENSFPVSWLLKSLSVMIESQCGFPEDIGVEMRGTIFSLLNLTSKLVRTICRERLKSAVRIGEKKSLDSANEKSEQSEYFLQMNPEENSNALESIFQLLAELEENMQKSLPIIENACRGKTFESTITFQYWIKLSMSIACFHGLLRSLGFTLGDKNLLDGNCGMIFLSGNIELMSRLNSCVDTFVSSTTSVLKLLFLEDGASFNTSAFGDKAMGGANLDLEDFLPEIQQQEQYLKKSVLLKSLSAENAEMSIFLRHLYITFSAVLRLNLEINLTSSFWNILPIMIGISQFLLLEFSKSEMLTDFAIGCIDGVVKFLKELGNYFRQLDPSEFREVLYVKLIGLHLRAIGKCISSQGKEAKLASQETGSHAKKLNNHIPCFSSLGLSQVPLIKKRLRLSFCTYIKSSNLHLQSAIRIVERAIVGVQEGAMANYEIVFGGTHGGDVSSFVAAGIDALDLILEYIIGTKRLKMDKSHIPNLVACLHNVILNLQGPGIFFRSVDFVKACAVPDSGSIIHMCMEALTKISRIPSLSSEIDGCHVAESLRVPGALFQYFLQLQIPPDPACVASKIYSSNMTIDRKFSVELYASCCRMLCTALKNHKSETRKCLAILNDSVTVLLHCLENASGRELFSWEVQEAVLCASSLRRVYEEVRNQKNVFGRHSFLLLSQYISAYCGLGPSKNGIMREVHEALKPGLYALLDCLGDDYELLHTQFGDGSRRALLAQLQHEYKTKFHFEGKI